MKNEYALRPLFPIVEAAVSLCLDKCPLFDSNLKICYNIYRKVEKMLGFTSFSELLLKIKGGIEMPTTYPNQRTIKIHRGPTAKPYLGINHASWQYAARDLGYVAFLLYIYLAANADGYDLALSPEAVRQAVGMPHSTYRDQFRKLVDKGYLVPSHGNTFHFYEIPKTRDAAETSSALTTPETQNQSTADENLRAVPEVESQNREINNKDKLTNNLINTVDGSSQNIYIPKVKEIVIQRPEVKSKKGEFNF